MKGSQPHPLHLLGGEEVVAGVSGNLHFLRTGTVGTESCCPTFLTCLLTKPRGKGNWDKLAQHRPDQPPPHISGEGVAHGDGLKGEGMGFLRSEGCPRRAMALP